MFNNKLRNFRKSLDLTQKEFADKCGFSRTVITELESGRKKPTLKAIKRICEATNTSVSDWIDKGVNLDFFESTKILIDYLIENNKFNSDAKLDNNDLDLLIKMFIKDVEFYVSTKIDEKH